MAYDEKLVVRVRKVLAGYKAVTEIKMFGGICFMHKGNMLCGVDGDRLMVRVGPEQYDDVLSMKHARVMDITGKPMKGFIFVHEEGFRDLKQLKKWIELGLNFTASLPPKKPKSKAKKNNPAKTQRRKR